MTLLEVTGDKIWQNRAGGLADSMLDRFSGPEGSCWTTPNEKDLLIRIRDEGDMEMPSGTSMAIDLLLRLHGTSAEARYLDAAANAIRRLSGQFQDHPESWASAVMSLNRYPLPPISENATAANTGAGTSASGDLRSPLSPHHVRVAPSQLSFPHA